MVIDPNHSIKPGQGDTQRPAPSGAQQNKAAGTEAEQARQGGARDRVELSAQGQSMSRLEERVGQLPDVDSERVANIKQAILEGRFEVDAERVAERLLNQDELLG